MTPLFPSVILRSSLHVFAGLEGGGEGRLARRQRHAEARSTGLARQSARTIACQKGMYSCFETGRAHRQGVSRAHARYLRFQVRYLLTPGAKSASDATESDAGASASYGVYRFIDFGSGEARQGSANNILTCRPVTLRGSPQGAYILARRPKGPASNQSFGLRAPEMPANSQVAHQEERRCILLRSCKSAVCKF